MWKQSEAESNGMRKCVHKLRTANPSFPRFRDNCRQSWWTRRPKNSGTGGTCIIEFFTENNILPMDTGQKSNIPHKCIPMRKKYSRQILGCACVHFCQVINVTHTIWHQSGKYKWNAALLNCFQKKNKKNKKKQLNTEHSAVLIEICRIPEALSSLNATEMIQQL